MGGEKEQISATSNEKNLLQVYPEITKEERLTFIHEMAKEEYKEIQEAIIRKRVQDWNTKEIEELSKWVAKNSSVLVKGLVEPSRFFYNHDKRKKKKNEEDT